MHWLRESFADARRHDDAMVQAMYAAFIDFVGRLDPRDLATRFERSARRKTMGNWELYGDFYRSLCEMQPGTLPHIFVETFAQNYETAAREGEDGDPDRRRLTRRPPRRRDWLPCRDVLGVFGRRAVSLIVVRFVAHRRPRPSSSSMRSAGRLAAADSAPQRSQLRSWASSSSGESSRIPPRSVLPCAGSVALRIALLLVMASIATGIASNGAAARK